MYESVVSVVITKICLSLQMFEASMLTKRLLVAQYNFQNSFHGDYQYLENWLVGKTIKIEYG